MKISLALTILPAALATPWAAKRAELAPLHRHGNEAVAIPGKYIVRFKDASVSSTVKDALKVVNAKPEHVFEHLFRGFASELGEESLNSLREHPDVDFVEEDGRVSINSLVKQSNAPWGLVRISTRNRTADTDYIFDNTAGSGTCAYVIDTGVEDTHPDFNGRAKQLVSFVPTESTDRNGHGTHVAGTIGSSTYGVAKGASIYGVKVLANDGRGLISSIIAGMDFVAGDAADRSCPYGVVVNLSLTSDFSQTVNDAAANLVNRGFFVGVAAGNDNVDASQFSPASERSVCTVAATTMNDTRASFSNYGTVVDVNAPGVNITSTWVGGGVNTISGTSMATPHVVGLAAYLARLNRQKVSPAVCQYIRQIATRDVIGGVDGFVINLLAYNDNDTR